ncbi:TetR/AcrR family transcriptional regulator [Chelatococcus asaccharovorans]|uniref:TetR family transcriptional regulator n=1 Tax=Chelatococcus asaccharovorans TaxID=28210 RepID=A0A2V3TR45_9HYPH|nr:TetR/AcrR family transcriptional regulator [Chelatococcus asaccharovorans]MBS7707850.1 TetR family transcriptional regulator [Chelatococcus asaccharovorans]PXW50903.1 TetR family transcriptional regulator [Chelatococcus asaccharovorans]
MRTLGSKGEETEKLLREAGVKLIAMHGFEAVSLRMLAKEVGIQAGSLYNYITNKQDFLFSLLSEIIKDLNAEMAQAMDGIDDPVDKLRRFIAVHIEFHTRRKDEVFIGNMELRSLNRTHRATIVKMRNAYEDQLKDILSAGIKSGDFQIRDSKVVRLGLFAMITAVSHWYRPDGPNTIEELIEEYTALAFDLLRVPAEGEVAVLAKKGRKAATAQVASSCSS